MVHENKQQNFIQVDKVLLYMKDNDLLEILYDIFLTYNRTYNLFYW